MTVTNVDPDALDAEFLSVMGGVCAPVVVVTAMDGDRPHGTTVSAFASLSRRPPMILVALDVGSDLLGIIRKTGSFGINVLSDQQPDTAMAFARKGQDKFAGVAWHPVGGVPRLDGSTGWLSCEVADLVPGGDHVIVLGNVVGAEDAPERPLVYHRRVFGTHAAIDDASDATAQSPEPETPAPAVEAVHPLATTYGQAMDELYAWMDFN